MTSAGTVAGVRRVLSLTASAPWLIIGVLGAGLRATVTRKHVRAARKAADAAFPGLLRVLGSRTLFPASTGSEVTFALADDPDAVVRLRIESGAEDLGPALRAAVARGRRLAGELRCLLAAFADGGHPVVAVDANQHRPWVAVDLTNDTVTARITQLGHCAREWTARHTRLTSATELASAVQVVIVSSPVVAALPDPGPELPTSARLCDPARLRALRAAPAFLARYPIGDLTPSHLYPSRSDDGRREFEARVRAQAVEWLRANAPGAVVTRPASLWSLVPGRVDRSTGHVLFADPPPRGTRPQDNHALAVTVDHDGTFTAPPVMHRDVRDAHGAVRLPPA